MICTHRDNFEYNSSALTLSGVHFHLSQFLSFIVCCSFDHQQLHLSHAPLASQVQCTLQWFHRVPSIKTWLKGCLFRIKYHNPNLSLWMVQTGLFWPALLGNTSNFISGCFISRLTVVLVSFLSMSLFQRTLTTLSLLLTPFVFRFPFFVGLGMGRIEFASPCGVRLTNAIY